MEYLIQIIWCYTIASKYSGIQSPYYGTGGLHKFYIWLNHATILLPLFK